MKSSTKTKNAPVPKKIVAPTAKKLDVKKAVAPKKAAAKVPAKPAQEEVLRAKKVTLSLSVPEKAAAFVAGDFNDWKPTELKMKNKGKGVFSVQLSLKPGRYEYKFLVDGQWQHDPACPESVANAFGSFNSLLVVE